MPFAGVAHLVERDLAKVEVASSSLVARSKNTTLSGGVFFVCASALTVVSAGCRRLPQPTAGTLPRKRLASSAAGGASALSSSPAPKRIPHPIGWGILFGMCRSTGELAASTCAKRVKSRGEAGFLRMATAIRGMPGSEFEPRRPLQKHHPIGWCFFRVRLSAHRRVSRLTAATAADSRDTSSKAPRFIRRRRRFGAFLVARSKNTTLSGGVFFVCARRSPSCQPAGGHVFQPIAPYFA